MSQERALSYITRAVRLADQEHLEPRDEALIMASLAQTEATLELVSLFRAGLPLAPLADDALAEFAMSARLLAERLRERT